MTLAVQYVGHAGPQLSATWWRWPARHDGALYAMLADATGHGLAAAVSSCRPWAPFTAAPPATRSRAGDRTQRPALRPAAPGILSPSALVRPKPPVLRVKSGSAGVPDAADHRTAGEATLHPVSCRSVSCLGRGRVVCEAFSRDGPGQIVLCLDGLTEASNPAGEAFGHEGLSRPCGCPSGHPAPGTDPPPGRAAGRGRRLRASSTGGGAGRSWLSLAGCPWPPRCRGGNMACFPATLCHSPYGVSRHAAKAIAADSSRERC